MRSRRGFLAVLLLIALLLGAWALFFRSRGNASPARPPDPSDAEASAVPGLAASARGDAPATKAAHGRTPPLAPNPAVDRARLDVDVTIPTAEGTNWGDVWVNLLQPDGAAIMFVSALTADAPVQVVRADPGATIVRTGSEPGAVHFAVEGIRAAKFVAIASLLHSGTKRAMSAPVSAESSVAGARVSLPMMLLEDMPVVEVHPRQAGEYVRAGVVLNVGGVLFDAGSMMQHEAPGPVVLHAPPGVEVEVRLNGYPLSEEFGLPPAKRLVVPAGGRERVDFDLPAGAPVSIRLVDAAGAQVPNRTWRLLRLEDGAAPRRVPIPFTYADPEVIALRLPAGRYGVLVQAMGEFGAGWQEFTAGEGGEVRVVVSREGTRLAVELTDASGQPLARASVYLSHDDPSSPRDLSGAGATTDERGRALFPPLPDGAYRMYVSARRLFERPVRLDGRAPEDLRFRMPVEPAGISTGSITGASKWTPEKLASRAAPSSAVILAEPVTGDWGVSVNPKPDGTYDITGLPAGAYRMRAFGSTWTGEPIAPYDGGVVSVRAGEVTRHDIALVSR